MMSSGGKSILLRQQVVAALADPDLALVGVGLALLVEGHHDHRGAVTAHELRLAQEFGFAFLERDRVHHRLALHAFQAGLDHLPFRRIDHHRHARDVGFGGDEVEEPHHRRLRVEHRLVHVDVDDLRAVLHLLPRDVDRARVVAGEDQLGEGARAGDIGAFADVDEQRVVGDVERLEAGKAHQAGHGVGAGSGRVRLRQTTGRHRRAAACAAAGSSPRRRSRGCARASCRSSRRRC